MFSAFDFTGLARRTGSDKVGSELRKIGTMCSILSLLVVVPLGCSSEPVGFTLATAPELIYDVIPGQQCIILVQATDAADAGADSSGNITLSAEVEGAEVMLPEDPVAPGEVAEITVIPSQESVNSTITVTITGQRRGIEQTQAVELNVVEGDIEEYETSLAPAAAEVRDLFIPWLVANHPELNIPADTAWAGVVVSPYILVVSHYMFLSDEWEMGVAWHIMIPPFDWAEIYLRRRSTELTPSFDFKIDSRSDEEQEPYATEVPEDVWR